MDNDGDINAGQGDRDRGHGVRRKEMERGQMDMGACTVRTDRER